MLVDNDIRPDKDYSQILIITTSGDFCQYITATGKTYVVWKSMKRLLAELPADAFLQTERRFAVNKSHVNEIIIAENGCMVKLSRGLFAPVSRRNRARVLKELDTFPKPIKRTYYR